MTAYLDGYSGYSGVPEDAAAEILEKLMTHQQISSDEVARILKRYGVCGEPEALQIAYRKKVGQRLIASLRDPYGRREVFSTGSTYVLVDCCNGPRCSWNTSTRSWTRTWKRLIRHRARLITACRCCSDSLGIGGSENEII